MDYSKETLIDLPVSALIDIILKQNETIKTLSVYQSIVTDIKKVMDGQSEALNSASQDIQTNFYTFFSKEERKRISYEKQKARQRRQYAEAKAKDPNRGVIKTPEEGE